MSVDENRRTPLWFLAGAIVLGSVCIARPLASQTAAPAVDYHREVHAIFASRCLGCHSQEKRSGGLSLATYEDVLNGGRSGAVVKPGNSSASLIVQRINGSASVRMPLGGPPLTPAEIGVITSWIDSGARITPTAPAAKPKWEAPLALERPKAPASPWKNWSAPVDRVTAVYLANHGATEPKLVSDAVFARRVYLDIWGLLPPPQELQAFLNDRSPDKRPQLVGRLLADDRKYAENWISYWNDLLRNDEGVNYYSETAQRKSITRWLLAALESNRPYDQWVSKLLNPSAPGDPDGFLIGVNWRGSVSASQTPAMQAAQNAAQVFLGINLKCNSCHDSFISKWKLKDAYSLAAYFSTEESLRLYRCDIAQAEQTRASFLYPELNRTPASTSAPDRRATAAAIFTDRRNGRMPRTLVNRIWHRLLGRGIVENVDEMDGEPWSPELLDLLASDFVDSGYDLKALIAEILNSRAYQLPAVSRAGESPKEYLFRGPEVRRLTAEQFADAVASITGDWPVIVPEIQTPSFFFRPLSISGVPSEGAGLDRPTPQAAAQAELARQQAAQARQQAPPPMPISPLMPPGVSVREWRIAGSPLDRAFGRPIRDQVYSTRDSRATTLQALELVNGETLTHWLWRGARKMIGELPPEPASLAGVETNSGRRPVRFNIDISQAQKLYLVVADNLSTAPGKAAPLWITAELSGPGETTPLTALTPLERSGTREGPQPVDIAGLAAQLEAMRVKLPSVVVYDIAGKGFTRFQGAVGFEPVPLGQGETVQARFFVFDRQPSMDRLVTGSAAKPLPSDPPLKTISETVDRVYQYALGRAPTAAERRIADRALRDSAHPGRPSADGLADLLWAVLMTPEFQLIQ